MEQAELYAETNNNQFNDVKEILNIYKSKLSWNNDERILDIGCGPGNVTGTLILPIIPKTAQLVGIDISAKMVRFAENKYGNDQLKFITMDFGAKNIQEFLGCGSFTKVFSFYCLHWILNQRKSVENIWNILKPGGTALLVLVSWSPLFQMYKVMSKQEKWKEIMQDVDNYVTPYQKVKNPSEQYRLLLEDVGFKVLECYDKYSPVFFSTVDILKRSVIAVSPFVNRMSPSLQDEYIECMMNLLVKQDIIRLERNSSGEEELSILKPNRLIVAFCQK